MAMRFCGTQCFSVLEMHGQIQVENKKAHAIFEINGVEIDAPRPLTISQYKDVNGSFVRLDCKAKLCQHPNSIPLELGKDGWIQCQSGVLTIQLPIRSILTIDGKYVTVVSYEQKSTFRLMMWITLSLIIFVISLPESSVNSYVLFCMQLDEQLTYFFQQMEANVG
jgi:hypothetical protein